MAEPANKWWWLPGALMAIAGLVFLATAEIWGNEEVWIALGVGFIAVSAFVIYRLRPRSGTA